MYKFKVFVDFEKEEQWLKEMASNGYHLQNTLFGYHFKRSKPETTTIKIDFRKFKNNEDFLDYCSLFEDSGWKHLAGSKSSGMQYFKQTGASEGDEIFSDTTSKAARYKRYANMTFEMAMSFLPLLIIFYLTDVINFTVLAHPKELYFTPGLWEQTGLSFWLSFLFETPFALMRGFAWSFIPITIILYLLFSYRSNQLYLQHTTNTK